MNPTPNLDQICAELYEFVSSNIVANTVEFDKTTQLSSLGIDSFSLIEIVLFIERKYGVVLMEEALQPENLKSIEAIATCTFQQKKMM